MAPEDDNATEDCLEKERRDFNQKIRTKLEHGFIPDIRRMKRNPYFVKQFWREPFLVKLYLGQLLERYQRYLLRYVGPGATVLDVGCGAGYLSLELARMGFRVTAIDVADEAVAAAQATLDTAEKTDAFGYLEYRAVPLAVEHFPGTKFDAVVFSASLHHFPDIETAVRSALGLCRPGGILLAYEPSRETWTEDDASVLTLVRCALSITGNWYDPHLASAADSEDAFHQAALAVLAECTENKDEFTPEGQSESDDGMAGPKIHKAFSEQAELLVCEPANAFLHTGLGGLRAQDERTLHQLAQLLATFERYALERRILKPNSELFVARAVSASSA